MDEYRPLRFEPAFPEGAEEFRHALGPVNQREASSPPQDPGRRLAEIPDGAVFLPPRRVLFGRIVREAAVRAEVGGIGENRVDLAARVPHRQIPHVLAESEDPGGQTVPFGVAGDERDVFRLDLRAEDRREPLPCRAEQGDDARSPAELDRPSAGFPPHERPEQIRVRPEGQSRRPLDQGDPFVDGGDDFAVVHIVQSVGEWKRGGRRDTPRSPPSCWESVPEARDRIILPASELPRDIRLRRRRTRCTRPR